MKRTLSASFATMTKTFTFGLMHVGTAFAVAWWLTGDWMTGGAVALIEPAINTVGYFVHERFWMRRNPDPLAA